MGYMKKMSYPWILIFLHFFPLFIINFDNLKNTDYSFRIFLKVEFLKSTGSVNAS